MSGPSRNAPCPCGSGEKFKRCCGLAASPDGHFTASDRSSGMRRLLRFANRDEFESDRAIAEQIFWGEWSTFLDEPGFEPLVDSDLAWRNFMGFLTIDMAVDGGRTLIELMLDRRRHALAGGERRYLEALRDSYIGLYKLAEVESGGGALLRNLWFEEDDIRVENAELFHGLGVGDLVATRLMTGAAGEACLVGDLYAFTAEHEPAIRQALESDRIQAEAAAGRMSPQEFLKRAGFRFNWLWMDSAAGEIQGHTRYPYHCACLTDYLDRGDLSKRISAEGKRVGLYLGRIAAAASQFEPGQQISTDVECRRRPDHSPCHGWIMATIHESEGLMEWDCAECGDAGSIADWKGTPFDLSQRPDDPNALPRTLAIGHKSFWRLFRLGHLSAASLTLLVSGHEQAHGEVLLAGSENEYAALGQCVAMELERADLSAAARKDLGGLYSALCWAADIEPDREADALSGQLQQREVPRPHPTPLPSPHEADGGHCLHVQLQHVEPPVWRRIEVPSDTPLFLLHHVLIGAIGWEDSHLHLFRQGRRIFALPETIEQATTDTRTVLVGQILPHVGDRLLWEYDFGDGWCHEIRVESITAERPTGARLLAGERACPPEDCGGPPGYEHLLEVLADPEHLEYAESRDWAGERFNPEAFDAERANARLGRMLGKP